MLTDRSPRRSRPGTAARAALLALAASLAACAGDRAPTAPAAPSSIPGAAVAAFQLTIDVASGRVTVGRPASSAQLTGGAGERPSLSLVGSDAVAVHATDCAFTAVPNSATKKRCTLSLAIENRLQYTDLVTATTFPRPPQGTNGILVFPFSAAALGVPGGSATPNADWDRAPANFFNDFGGCSGKSSDCYRSELYTGPLYAGETSAARTVGFDIDRNAHTVSAYVVVAADLRDNPQTTLTIEGDADRCGRVSDEIPYDPSAPLTLLGDIKVAYDGFYAERARGFCSFDLAGVPQNAEVLLATLRLYQRVAVGAYDVLGPVVIDHMDYGTLDDSDWGRAALASDIGSFTPTGVAEYQSVGVAAAVRNDLTSGRSRSQFRLLLTTEAGGFDEDTRIIYSAPGSANPPQLVVKYRLK